MSESIAAPILLADYRPPEYLCPHIRLDVRLIAHGCTVSAELDFTRNEGTTAGTPLTLDGDGIVLKAVHLNGERLGAGDYTATPQGFTLHAPPAQPFTLRFETVVDAEANTQFMGLYRSSGVWCTQCEADGFRRITYCLDRPDVMSVYDTRIEADKSEAPVLLGNGNPVRHGDVPGTDRHFALWDDPHPKPCYLFALVGGRLNALHDSFTTRSGRAVRLGIYVEQGKENRCAYAMDALKRSMAWDENVFGCEYDLDVFNVVAVSDFNMGAMENKGLNIFNDKYVLALPDTATDSDYAGIETVIAHEYFHNWTGNRITCRDWFQLCLKEGLTVYRDQEFSADMRSRTVKRIEDVRRLWARQFAEDAGPLAHAVRPNAYREINNLYTPTVYEKGAEVIRVLRALIGESAFSRGMMLYLTRHDGEAATLEQFIACFAESAGRDLTQFFRWYEQAGTPQLTVTTEQAGERLTVHVKQMTAPTPGQSEKPPLVIPLALGIIGRDGREALPTTVLTIDKPEQSFSFDAMPNAPVLSLNRGFAAPIKVISAHSNDDLALLARHDTDRYNRWQAVQTLFTDWLMREARAPGSQRLQPLVTVAAGLLEDATDDPAFSAQALTPPNPADMAREMATEIDPDAIQAALTRLKAGIGASLRPTMLAVIDALPTPDVFSADAAAAGRRMLVQVLLQYCAADGDAAMLDRVLAANLAADNMTDRHGTLLTLCQHASVHRKTALAAFRRRHDGDAIALDKWLAAQATIPEAATLARVQHLAASDDFTLGNPNRCSALIGSFVAANAVAFARADGEGFRYAAEVLLALDALNPQTAARLTSSAFKSWRSYEPVRRQAAETALRTMAAADLSADCRDIVGRCLAS